MPHEFEAVLHRLEGKMPFIVCYAPFSVPEDGTQGRLEVKGTVDGHPFRGTLLPSRNGHYFVFNKALRDLCGKQLGDSVRVTLEADAAPRTVEVPEDVAAALAADAKAKAAFDAQPDYMKREHIAHITSAKRPETRERRVAALVARLAEGGRG